MNGLTRVKIGSWTADPDLNALEREGASFKLEPRAMDVLSTLSQHPNKVISVEELISSVWKDTVVSDNSVYLTISQLRQVLDTADDGPYIETIPKRGYRLTAPVSTPDSVSAAALSQPPTHQPPQSTSNNKAISRQRVGVVTVVVLVVIAVAVFLFNWVPNRDLPSSGSKQAEQPPTQSPVAHAYYLKATSARDDAARDFFRQTIADLDQALAADPQFAQAYVARGDIHWSRYLIGSELPPSTLPFDFDPEVEIESARRDAERALELRPDLAQAHALIARITMFLQNPVTAEKHYRRALELNPEDPNSLRGLAVFLIGERRNKEARELLDRVVAKAPGVPYSDAFLYLLAGDLESATAVHRANVDAHPDDGEARMTLGVFEALRGNTAESVKELRLAEALDGYYTWPLLVYGYGRLGLREDAQRVFDLWVDQETDAELIPIFMLYAYLGIGDMENAYQWASKISDSELPPGTSAELAFTLNAVNDPVLNTPSFVALRRKLENKK